MNRQITVGEVIGGTFALARARPRAVIACVLLDAALNFALDWTHQRFEMEWALFTLLVAAVFLSTTIVATFAVGHGTSAFFGLGPTEVFIRAMYGVAVWTITSVAAVLGLLALILPGLYLLGRWFVAMPLVLIDGCDIIEAIAKSWSLTEQSAWPLTSVSALIFGANFASLYINEALTGGYPAMAAWLNAAQLLINGMCTVFGAVAAVFVMIALSSKPEGLVDTFA
jgi:hypothetical protein